jgi:hypothetical protein
VTLTVSVYLTPTVLVNVPAKNPTMAKHPYSAAFVVSTNATFVPIDPPAPSPDKALNIPGQQRHTSPSNMTCISGVFSFWRKERGIVTFTQSFFLYKKIYMRKKELVIDKSIC